jgi:hypothetical protein
MHNDPSITPQNAALDTGKLPGQSDFLERVLAEGLGVVDALRISVEHFEFLRGLPHDEVAKRFESGAGASSEERRSLETLRAISRLTQDTMRRMNEAHAGLPPDTLATTLGLVTRPGASVVVLHGRASANIKDPEEVLGYGIVIRGRENFPESEAQDPAHRIPDVLFEGSDTHHRLIRLFVGDSAREQDAAGGAFDLIINQIKKVCGDEPIIGMVLTDLLCLDGAPQDEAGKWVWLEAKAALEKRGFEDTGLGLNEVVAAEGKPVVTIPFRWYMYPPRTEVGRQAFEALQTRYAKVESEQRCRLAGIATELPLSGASVLHVGTLRDGFDLSRLSGNQVYAEVFESSNPQANRQVRRPNLVSWQTGTGLTLPPETVDALVINGVLPDIARRGDSPHAEVRAFIESQLAALKTGGTLLVRDTVAPPNRAPVCLYLNAEERFPWSNGKTVAELFEEFAASGQESSVYPEEWRAVQRLHDAGALACFYAPSRVAAEFLLKYPYAQDWAKERARPYALQSAEDRLSLVSALGLRLVYAAAEFNPVILERNRAASVTLTTPSGIRLDSFPTNHVTVAQKVAPEDGLGFLVGKEVPVSADPFVKVTRYEEVNESGELQGVREVASRKAATLDVIPYRVDQGRLYVWGRIFPRPITKLHPALDGTVHGGYFSEQLAAVVPRDSLTNSDDIQGTTRAIFNKLTGTVQEKPLEVLSASRYFVRPDTVDEEVVSAAIHAPDFTLQGITVSDPDLRFGGRYAVRAFDGVRILQGQQAGHTQDARLERKVYELLVAHTLSCGPWIGEEMTLSSQGAAPVRISPMSDVLSLPEKRAYRRAEDQNPRFLKTSCREFTEYTARGSGYDRGRQLEYVEPDPSTGLTHQSLSLLPVAKVQLADGSEQIVVGLEIKNLPAVQEKTGSSLFVTIPTARIPASARSVNEAQREGTEMLSRVFGLSSRATRTLGGKYAVSPGVTPETMYPLIVEVDLSKSRKDSLVWLPLRDVIPHIPKLQCAQAVTSLYRAAHLFGELRE